MSVPRLAIILVCSIFCPSVGADESGSADFAIRDGDTVAFLGDSITAARNYSKVVENYVLMRFPEQNNLFINAGKGGETAQTSLERLDEAVLSKGVDVLTVAYGVNDIGWGMKADAEHKQAYLDGIATIVDRCHKSDVRVFICSAAITAEDPDTAEKGFLQSMCDEGLSLAKSKNAGTIDVMRAMRSVQRRILAANAKEPDESKHKSLHVADGVHLNDVGQMAMAWAILKGLGAPANVSSASINANDGSIADQKSCVIREVAVSESGLTFTRLDERLPFNMQPLWTLLGWHIPVSDDLNRYRLTIVNLAPGRYEITGGGRALGSWSEKDLARGINLASATADPWVPGGPWHGQGQVVSSLTTVRDDLDWAGRTISKFLNAHPGNEELREQAAAIEAAVVKLQRELATPVPVRFEVTLERTTTDGSLEE